VTLENLLRGLFELVKAVRDPMRTPTSGTVLFLNRFSNRIGAPAPGTAKLRTPSEILLLGPA
jgi:hypothetical protein